MEKSSCYELRTRVKELERELLDREEGGQKALEYELAVNSALSELYGPLLDPKASFVSISKAILDKSKSLTKSEHGYVSSLDPITGDAVAYTIADMLTQQCRVSGENRKTVFPRSEDGVYPGLWGYCLNTLEAFFTNSPREHLASSGIPWGHIPIERFLSAPVIIGEELVGQISLANKDQDYAEKDLEIIRRLAVFYALAIQLVRTEESLRKAKDELEERVKERTAKLAGANVFLKREVAQRKQAEEALRESEEKYGSLVESSEDSIYLLDRNCRFVFANQKQLSRLGLGEDTIVGKSYSEFHSEDDSKELVEKVHHVFKTKKSVQHEHRSSSDGRYFLRTLSPMQNPKREIVGITMISKDITALKQAKEVITQSETKYRGLFEESRDGIYMTTREGKFVDINQSGLNLFGYTRKRLMRLNIKTLYSNPKERTGFQREIEQKGFARDYEVKLRRKDGKEIECLINATVRKGDDGSIQGYQGIIRDITAARKAERQIRGLWQQLIKTQEIERRKLAWDLHDNLAQDLSAAKISIDTLIEDEPEVSSEHKESLLRSSEMITKAVKDVRDLAYDLHPADMSRVGLVQTASRYCEEFSSKNDLTVDFSCMGLDKTELGFDTEIGIYRLIQEGLSNIKKHANATRAGVRLIGSHPSIIVLIEDNGKGFEVKKRLDASLKRKRMGLWSMEQRASLLNGKMEIKSRPGHGTKIHVEIPYKEQAIG